MFEEFMILCIWMLCAMSVRVGLFVFLGGFYFDFDFLGGFDHACNT